MEFNQKFFLAIAAAVCAIAIVVMLYSFIKSYFFRDKSKEDMVPSDLGSGTTISINDMPGNDVSVTASVPIIVTVSTPNSSDTTVTSAALPITIPSVAEVIAIPASSDIIVFKIEDAKPKEDKWGVKSSNGVLSTHKTQHDAEKAAIEVAKQLKVSVVILGRSGEIRKKMMYTK